MMEKPVCVSEQELPMWFENFDIKNIITPIKAEVLEHLLSDAGYDTQKSRFLVNGFKNGFPLHYEGVQEIQRYAPI